MLNALRAARACCSVTGTIEIRSATISSSISSLGSANFASAEDDSGFEEVGGGDAALG